MEENRKKLRKWRKIEKREKMEENRKKLRKWRKIEKYPWKPAARLQSPRSTPLATTFFPGTIRRQRENRGGGIVKEIKSIL